MALPPGARGCLRFVIVVFHDHTHYFLYRENVKKSSLKPQGLKPWYLVCSIT